MSTEQTNYIKKVNIYRRQMPTWAKNLLKAIFITFIICCAFVAVFSFIYICTPVNGPSMLPTLNSAYYDGGDVDSVYINRFAGYNYGDIVVVHNPDPESTQDKYVIKRVIAKEYDKVAIVPTTSEVSEETRTYKIFLIKNGTNQRIILSEDYLASGLSLYKTYSNFRLFKNGHSSVFQSIDDSEYGQLQYLLLQKNQVFILGDNRADSNDSSSYGPVDTSKVIGRVDIIVPESKNNFSRVFMYFWNKLFG